MYDVKTLDLLEKRVAKRLSPSRMAHTVRVRETVRQMCERLSLGDSSVFEAAALLHDVAKEESFEKQLQLAFESATIEDMAEGERYAPVLHGYAALSVIHRDFPDFAEESILRAVRYHTTGAPAMSHLTAVVFLADYIEYGRKPENCIIARKMFFEKTEEGDLSEKMRAFHECVLFALSKTAAFLKKSNLSVHPDTERAIEYYRALLL